MLHPPRLSPSRMEVMETSPLQQKRFHSKDSLDRAPLADVQSSWPSSGRVEALMVPASTVTTHRENSGVQRRLAYLRPCFSSVHRHAREKKPVDTSVKKTDSSSQSCDPSCKP